MPSSSDQGLEMKAHRVSASLLARLAARFHVREVVGAGSLGGDKVLFAQTDGGEDVVIKVSKDQRRLAAEVEALRAFGEQRALKVLDVWPEEGVALLERVVPGVSLASESTEDEALDVIAGLLARRWPAVPKDSVAEPIDSFLDTLEQPIFGHSAGTCPVDRSLLQRAHATFKELLADRVPP